MGSLFGPYTQALVGPRHYAARQNFRHPVQARSFPLEGVVHSFQHIVAGEHKRFVALEEVGSDAEDMAGVNVGGGLEKDVAAGLETPCDTVLV